MLTQSTRQIIQAVDIGYGHTKYVIQRLQDEIQCGSFPSFAPLAHNEEGGLSTLAPARNCVTVLDSNGKLREVGRDAALLSDGTNVRNMDDNYTTAPEYLALFRGALRHMAQRDIDMLVTGLPVNLYKLPNQKETLEQILTGAHKMPDGDEYFVKKVIIVPQPFGGFFDFSVTNKKFDDMRRQTNLMIDPGERTFDWLVMQGMKPMPNLSHAHPKSMGAIIEAIAQSLGRELKTNITSLQSQQRISQSLRDGEHPIIRGQQRDISKHMAGALEIAEEALTAMSKKIGEANDIDNIIVCGGGAKFFYELIKCRYPDHTVLMNADPMYSNVRGYQIAGELWMRQQTKNRVAA
ncbi:PRTRC system protein D [Duganella vulcania]|uniref:PRTRC system protein D n=1 Tax=Duganella vulcania TaxID=2692166 RepID=A0A845GGZ2_9BURK|nr:PRTRC system protein D [Duganella vulcania]MYM92692.1 PRTRC system protein D [Duganella vulcania]